MRGTEDFYSSDYIPQVELFIYFWNNFLKSPEDKIVYTKEDFMLEVYKTLRPIHIPG